MCQNNDYGEIRDKTSLRAIQCVECGELFYFTLECKLDIIPEIFNHTRKCNMEVKRQEKKEIKNQNLPKPTNSVDNYQELTEGC